MQIVACQLDIAWEDKPANFERTRSLLRGASIQTGALIVLPEMFATGFSMHVDTHRRTGGRADASFSGRPCP